MSTTLEILAPYLPYSIEVKWKHGQARHYELTGLVTQTSTCYLEGKYSAFADDLLPVLRDFSQLTVPLPGGTEPAAVVMMREMGYSADRIWVRKSGAIEVLDSEGISTVIWADWGIGLGSLTLAWAKMCYKYHFAINLEPHQYIPLTAPSTPTREADNTATTIL